MFIDNKYKRWYFNIIKNSAAAEKTSYIERHHIIPKSLGGSNDPDNIVKLSAREHFICHLLLTKMVSSNEDKRKMVYAAWQQSRSSKLKGGKITNRTYESLKKQLSEHYTGRKRKPFSEEWKQNMKKAAKIRKKVEYSKERLEKIRELGCSAKGRNISEEHKRKISAKLKDRKLTSEHKEKIGISKVGKSREPFSEEWREKLSASHLGLLQSEETKKKKSLSMKGKNSGKPSPFKGVSRSEEVKKKISESRKKISPTSCPHCKTIGKGGNMKRYHFDKCRNKTS